MEEIIVPTSDGKIYVFAHSIIRIQSLDNYSKLYFFNRKPLVVSKVLLWFECRLSPKTFARIHRSHLVNLQYINGVSGDSHQLNVLLTNGEAIRISRRKRGLFKNIAMQDMKIAIAAH